MTKNLSTMKTTMYLFSLLFFSTSILAQEISVNEKYGKSLNLGLGVGYYGYIGHSMPVFHVDYELDVARNFTLSPFIALYSYRNEYYSSLGNSYYYHETVVPVGVKGTYYFDDLLDASADWDFYLATSVGFAFAQSYWDKGYEGDKDAFRGANPIFIDIHLGTEYHVNKKIGIFFDLSTGVSTIGVAIHSI